MTASNAVFIGGDIYRRPGFGSNHPLAIPRVSLVLDICDAFGWLEGAYADSPMASVDELIRFHDEVYVTAVKTISDRGQATAEDRARFNIGNRENPVFENMFERAATTCGGSMLAARYALEGRVAFNPAGGTHHGLRDRAHGFCYFNDPVFGILTLLDGGVGHVLYLDLDAHHGDGVEFAFADEPRVTTISIHEAGKWPGTGDGHGPAGTGIYNFTVPKGFNDSELKALINGAVLPMIDAKQPDAVVLTCGADGLAGDPLSGLALSNVGLWDAVIDVTARVPGAVVLGGGGYNPWTLSRCWAGLWGRLSGRMPPWDLPEGVAARLSDLDCDLVDEEDILPIWGQRIDDEPIDGRVRPEVAAMLDEFRMA